MKTLKVCKVANEKIQIDFGGPIHKEKNKCFWHITIDFLIQLDFLTGT